MSPVLLQQSPLEVRLQRDQCCLTAFHIIDHFALLYYIAAESRDVVGMKDSWKKKYIRYLPLYGCLSTGLVYFSIGVIAILSFLKLKDGGADESSLLAFLHESLAGKILFWVILTGTVCYILWRIFETITDPYEYGNNAIGISRRTGIAMSTIPDILIVMTAIQVLSGTGNIQIDGQPLAQRELVADMLQKGWGRAAVIGIGVIVMLTALVQFYYGITRGYKERLGIADFSHGFKKFVHALAWAGYSGRGVIVGIIGFFLIKAGIEMSAEYTVNTDKAFDFVGDHVGHVYFILLAAATICYGLFMFILGITYDADKG